MKRVIHRSGGRLERDGVITVTKKEDKRLKKVIVSDADGEDDFTNNMVKIFGKGILVDENKRKKYISKLAKVKEKRYNELRAGDICYIDNGESRIQEVKIIEKDKDFVIAEYLNGKRVVFQKEDFKEMF